MKQRRIGNFIKSHRHALAAFFLPVLIMTAAFAITGIYPFGPNQITVIDMYHQYVPFLSELQYKLHHGGSLFYSWDGAGGFNFWNLLAYYGASPLNLLLAVFPERLIVEAVTVLLLLKVGLAGCFMYLYLMAKGRPGAGPAPRFARNPWIAVCFGSFYALSAYTLAYYWCIMWMDAVALLPLCILGLERLTDQGRPLLYTVSLGLICFINYYIAIMVCIFIVLWYLVHYFSRARSGGFWGFVGQTGKTLWYSALGAGLSAAMLLPTMVSMKNAYYYSDDMPETFEFYNDPLEIFNQLLPNAQLSYREGLPNIYCGLLVVMLLALYFISRTIPFREKLLRGILLAVFFLSLNLNKLDFIWHGMHFPNQLPYRYSFVICFVLVGMAYQAICRLREVRLACLWAIFAVGLGYYLLSANLLGDVVDDKDAFFYLGVLLLGVYTAVLVTKTKGILNRRSFTVLLALCISAELLCSTAMGFTKVGNVERAPYLADSRVIAALNDETAGTFARTELYEWSIMNTPALYHYKGISQFSSSLNANATRLMEKIGVEGEPGKNRYNYVISDPVTNAILNMKYIISTDQPMEDDSFFLKDSLDGSNLYESLYPLSVGYMLPYSIRTWDTSHTNPFEVLDDYVRAATDNRIRKVFEPVGAPDIDEEELEISEAGDGIYEVVAESDAPGFAELSFTAAKAGNHYVYIEADGAEAIQVVREDGTTMDLREDCGAVVSIGSLDKEEGFSLQIDYEEGGEGNLRCHVCTMDETSWKKAYQLISRDLWEITDFSDRSLAGTIDVSEEGMFTTSVLNEKGWLLSVDGQRRDMEELEPVGDAFIAIPMSAGTHTVTLRFRPPGLIAGCIVMACAALLLAASEWLRRRRDRRTAEEAESTACATAGPARG